MSDALADLDPALFVQPPVFDVPGGIALGTALLRALDGTLPTTVQQAAERLETAVLVLERRWDEQRDTQARPDIDARTADLRLDYAWVAVGRRLEVLLDLPGHLPQAEQAAVLYRRLFPDDLLFLNLPFRRQWAQSERRLRMIEEQSLRPQLEPLVGGFVLDELHYAHEEYGRVLGIDDPKAALATPARVAEGLRDLRDAIAGYGLQLLAVAHADPGRAEGVRASLVPIANVRRGRQPDEGLLDLDVESLFDEPEDPRTPTASAVTLVEDAPTPEPSPMTMQDDDDDPPSNDAPATPAQDATSDPRSPAETSTEEDAAPTPIGPMDDTVPLDVDTTTPLHSDAESTPPPPPLADEPTVESSTPADSPDEPPPPDEPPLVPEET
ncbi:MAG: hypothetical protein AAGF11_36565 [Myxococcota bacterium]